jgi:hypothetical protein
MKVYAVIHSSIYVSQGDCHLYANIEDARKKWQEYRDGIVPDDYEHDEQLEEGPDWFVFDCHESGDIDLVSIVEKEIQ